MDFGPAASTGLPTFIDGNETEVWNPDAEPCDQPSFEDFTGVDSLTALMVSLIVFVSVQTIENATGKPLFTFAGLEGYVKEGVGHKSVDALEDDDNVDKNSGDTPEKDDGDEEADEADA